MPCTAAPLPATRWYVRKITGRNSEKSMAHTDEFGSPNSGFMVGGLQVENESKVGALNSLKLADAPPAGTRREFLGNVGKKAAYIAPIVMTLTASQARAGSAADFDSTCGDDGSPCTVDEDCCALNCVGMMTCMA